MARDDVRMVLEPEDEYTHEPDEATNYNESMYLNAFDAGSEVGGWFRREMTFALPIAGGPTFGSA